MTKLSIEERLQIIREIYLVIGHNDTVLDTNTPKIDNFYLTRAILEDKVYLCNNKQRLVGILKKSPVWAKVLPFIENNDNSCARKGCSCGKYSHTGPKEACVSSKYKRDKITRKWIGTKCSCPGFVKKKFE